jgi:hypothetical protein
MEILAGRAALELVGNCYMDTPFVGDRVVRPTPASVASVCVDPAAERNPLMSPDRR